MNRTKLTIHTATYNRAHTLSQAYKSLQNQTCFDFEWLITYDGSTDGTKDLVESWQKENNKNRRQEPCSRRRYFVLQNPFFSYMSIFCGHATLF